MNLFLRQAELKDAGFITELSNQLGYKTTIEKTQTRISEILNHPDHCVYVIIDNESIIAWIHCFYSLRVESAPFIEIGGLVVDEQHRRKGVGKLLVKQVLEWARSKKCNKIRVRCNTLREDAHMFYNDIGFTTTKEQNIFDMTID